MVLFSFGQGYNIQDTAKSLAFRANWVYSCGLLKAMWLTLLLFVVNIWVLSSAILTLHYYRHRVTFVPFLFAIAGITIVVQSQWGVYIEPIPEIVMFYSSGALVPVILMAVLVLYVAEGAEETRVMIWSIIGISLFFLFTQIFERAIALLPGGGSLFGPLLNDLIPALNVRVTIGSLLSFLADMFVIAVFYQGLVNYSPKMPQWLTIGLSLLAALWTDAIVFGLIADFGTPDFITLLPGYLISKTISAFILWPPTALYLLKLAPKRPGFMGPAQRRTLDLIFGNVQRVKMDLTQAETDMRQLNEQLEKRVAERTAELEYTNRELEAFSYSVSHDLRAPVRAISGYSEMFMQEFAETLPPDAKRFQSLIQSNAKKLAQLLDDLLLFSRYGRQPITKISVNPTEIVTEILRDLKNGGKPVEFHLNPLPPCYADPVLLRQVFTNLLENAVKFSGAQESPCIEVGSRPTPENHGGQKVIYFVKDNGVGFDMAYADKLFRVFSRLHSETEFEGTGVGLSIVQRIVNRHGGEVWAEAEVAKGATFYFSLPATTPPELPTNPGKMA